jgi:hypothetical protein
MTTGKRVRMKGEKIKKKQPNIKNRKTRIRAEGRSLLSGPPENLLILHFHQWYPGEVEIFGFLGTFAFLRAFPIGFIVSGIKEKAA